MKKITAIILAAALLAALAGCDKSGDSGSSSTNASTTQSTSTTVESTIQSTESTEPVSSANEVKVLSKICYMRPIYKSTLDDPNWRENTPGENYYEKAENWFGERNFEPKQFFDVKEGDKLENGLTVKEIIIYTHEDGTPMSEPEIRFEGTLEMEGTLFVQQKDNDYFWTARDLTFYPDSNKNPYIPMWTGNDDCVQSQLSENGDCVRADCTFQLGNIDESIIDEDEIFDGKTAVKVKLTVDNITVGNVNGLGMCQYCFGNIVDCERIDD